MRVEHLFYLFSIWHSRDLLIVMCFKPDHEDCLAAIVEELADSVSLPRRRPSLGFLHPSGRHLPCPREGRAELTKTQPSIPIS